MDAVAADQVEVRLKQGEQVNHPAETIPSRELEDAFVQIPYFLQGRGPILAERRSNRHHGGENDFDIPVLRLVDHLLQRIGLSVHGQLIHVVDALEQQDVPRAWSRAGPMGSRSAPSSVSSPPKPALVTTNDCEEYRSRRSCSSLNGYVSGPVSILSGFKEMAPAVMLSPKARNLVRDSVWDTRTVTLKVQVACCCAASVALHVTVESPRGNTVLDCGVQTTE